MNILFLTLVFDIKGNPIYTDLIDELKKRGNDIYIATTLERRKNKKTYLELYADIRILRVKTLNIQKTNLIEKGIGTLILEKQFIKAIKKNYSDIKFDLIIYSTPPITFEKVISYIKDRDNAKSYLLLKDIFPQNAVDIKMISKKGIKGFIYNYFRKKEESLYNISDYIGCMSEANVKYLKKNNGLNNKNIEVCPNSIVPTELAISNKSELRNKYSFDLNKKIFIYGGNLGKPQGIDFFIDIINSNKIDNNIIFLIIGNGTEFNKLESFIIDNKIKNTKIYSRLPKEEYDDYVRLSDVGLIFLDKRFTIPNFPSRLLGYMDYSLPVIAATDVNTDIGEIIVNNNFGYWCESGKLENYKNILQECCNGNIDLEKMGINSRDYLEKNYTAKHSADIILKHFN